MSVRARYEAMDFFADTAGEDPLAEELYEDPKFHGLPYSGIVSSHSWSDDGIYKKIYELGGVVTPAGDHAGDFVEEWAKQRTWFDDRYQTGFGYGSDTNGFSAHGGPSEISYPFTGFGGAVFDQQYSGPAAEPGQAPIGKTYDLNVDGVAHYGLFADWVESGRLLAGENGAEYVADMFNGAEAYLQMSERDRRSPRRMSTRRPGSHRPRSRSTVRRHEHGRRPVDAGAAIVTNGHDVHVLPAPGEDRDPRVQP